MPTYRGSRITPIRLPEELRTQVLATIERVNRTRSEEPFDLSSFIRVALREKIAKYARGNVKRKGKSRESKSRE